MTMHSGITSLVLKANRTLGAQLIDAGLIELPTLEAANQSFLVKRRAGSLIEASLLRILLYETQALREADLLNLQVVNHGLGSFQLDAYKLNEDFISTLDLDECQATWTLPFDFVGDVYFVATAYYLSPVVRQHWEERLGGHIVWSVHDLASIGNALEHLYAQRASSEAQAVPVAAG